MRQRLAALLPLALLGACGGVADPEPGVLSAREAQELNEAAEMLHDDAVAINALSPGNRR